MRSHNMIEKLYKIAEALNVKFPDGDDPLKTNWHRGAMNLLIDSVHSHWREHTEVEAETQRADAAEAEVTRLQALLAEKE